MAVITFSYDKPAWWFPRSYIHGLNCLGNLSSLIVSSSGITMHRNFLDVTFHLAWTYDFFPWSSNTFALATLFDPAASFCTVFGLPSSGGVLVSVSIPVNERLWRIKVQAYVENTPNNYFLLPAQPAGYWLPE